MSLHADIKDLGPKEEKKAEEEKPVKLEMEEKKVSPQEEEVKAQK